MPFFYSVIISFTDRNLASSLRSNFVGLSNYIYIFSDKESWSAIYTTFKYVFIVVSVEFILGILLAFLFQINFKYKTILRSIMILPMVATPVAMAFMWKLMYSPTNGIINYLLSKIGITGILWNNGTSTALISVMLVDIWQWTPFIFLIFTSAISALPKAPFEAALVDGASFIQMVRHVMFPLLKPIIAICLLFRIVDAFKAFDNIFILTAGGPGRLTETLNIRIYNTAFRYLKMGNASAMSVIYLIVVIVICNIIVSKSDFGLK